MIGQRFGRLTVVELVGSTKSGKRKWLCRCDCGERTVSYTYNLRGGHTRSCGCLHGEKHGKSGTPEYRAWSAMIERCANPNHQYFEYYGGRGIRVCAEWRASFSAFFSDMGPKPTPQHTVDRVDGDKDYEPGNCRWADKYQQAQNRRQHKNNSSGYKGVSWNKEERRWTAHITRNGVRRFLGYFNDLEAAAAARRAAEVVA